VFGSRSRRLAAARARFADELAQRCGLPAALRDAFAAVPRERFLPPGPWLVLEGQAGYESTPDADPARVYRDSAIAIDAARILNSSQPSLAAGILAALEIRPGESVVHVGCASGYYTAIAAELAGARGRIVGFEISPAIADWARRNLRAWRQVEVRQADALESALPEADVIWIDAGVTQIREAWLNALRPGGRLALPLTAVRASVRAPRFTRNHIGRVLFVQRAAAGLRARFGDGVAIMGLHGGRDVQEQRLLDAAYRSGGWERVRSLRRDPHAPEESCWVHVGAVCLSLREPSATEAESA
jgi:protein-L-isoaspartate(D-aspartate) O-methyltransferase